eukprot:TRINITY_DN14047_c0_g1_i1.p5 TRINITY_DN14047_c0_g1~~TRINITY_DN14047_c0_g1_i1.p5  ORF type:complete len:124 (-),score=38.52 TRINITY_DN14047_c0_g1_i1:179-550(-)
MKEHNIDYTFHDPQPYPCGDVADVYASIKEAGMFMPCQRTEGVSTSDIILRVIRHKDDFMRQALEKFSPEELNVSKEYAEYVQEKPEDKGKLRASFEKNEAEMIEKEIKRLQEEINKLKESQK